ncbi:MAG: ABC transporter ATP-binding protein [Selenomonadaceae bacterium]|nr:ABC transporter ATP-binding protein [Selenomonadaceae bacterium]
MSAANELLAIENLSVGFHTYRGDIKAVRGMSLTVGQGEILGIVGESGCGKSVTAQAVMGLLPKENSFIAGGRIVFRGQDITGADEAQLRQLRGREVAMIFQDPMTSLNPVLTIGYQMTEGIMLHKGVSHEEARQEAIALLDRVGIRSAKERMGAYPHEFSGGMRQRVMIAMALICRPKLLFADEPTTALDVTIQAQILKLLGELRQEYGMSIVLISHDLGVIASICDRVEVMYAGSVAEVGTAKEIFFENGHPYTQGLLRSLPRLDADRREPLPVIAGQPPDLSLDIQGCSFLPRCPYAMKVCRDVRPEAVPLGENHTVWCWRAYREQQEQGEVSARG